MKCLGNPGLPHILVVIIKLGEFLGLFFFEIP